MLWIPFCLSHGIEAGLELAASCCLGGEVLLQM